MSRPRPGGGSASRELARLYSPPAERPLLAALCDLEAQIGASVSGGLDHQVAHLRLEWWRAECTRTAAGQAAHPLTRSLTACFADAAPLGGLTGLVDAAVWDLAAATFESRREVSAYCERWADAMIVPLVAHAAPQVASTGARALGAALREAELLGGLARDASLGRLRLPLDELATAGVDPACLARPPPRPAPLAALLRARQATLRAQLRAAVAALPVAAQPALRGLLVWTALAAAAAHRTDGGRGLLDGWRAWRAARQAAAGRFSLDGGGGDGSRAGARVE